MKTTEVSTMNNRRLEKYVKAFKKGDEDAFDHIYEATRADVYYTIYYVVKDVQLSEDLMQDTYLKMIEHLERYEGRGKFRAWIKTIAKRTALNAIKQRQKETPSDQTAEYTSESAQLEKKAYTQELLEVLGEEEKEIVIRHAVLNETHKTIAEALDKPLGTITWKYKRALEKMRKEGGEQDA